VKVGDLVTYDGRRWKVATSNSQYRTCTLSRPNGPSIDVPDDLDRRPVPELLELKVLCHLSTEWPFIAASARPKAGPIVKITRGRRELVMMEDWVPSDFLRPGGSVFLNPDLRLKQGEVLAATHKDGSLSRLAVTGNFGTVKNRIARKNRPRRSPKPRTVYDRLMSDGSFEDPK
jgi:hypothetical protein